jgi:hypothetical protein
VTLTESHVQALMAMVDDMMRQVPGFVQLPLQPLVVVPSGARQNQVARVLEVAASGAR